MLPNVFRSILQRDARKQSLLPNDEESPQGQKSPAPTSYSKSDRGCSCWGNMSKNRQVHLRRLAIVLIVLVVITVVGVGFVLPIPHTVFLHTKRNPHRIWYSILVALIHRLSPPPAPSNGLQKIVSSWTESSTTAPSPPFWTEDFTRDITPVMCHSHNDYWRRIPLFDALSAGCSSVEADIFLTPNSDLLVGHSSKKLRSGRTLRSLYLDPLFSILSNQNAPSSITNSTTPQGVFDTNPNITLVLLLDFKTEGEALFPVVISQLQPFREKGWLTHYNGSALVVGPVTVVGTGNTPFSSVLSNITNPHRDIFFDAPLTALSSSPEYTPQNSYYASTSLSAAIGRTWFNKISSSQQETLKSQIKIANERGLVSRYWDLPAWPVSFRTNVWKILKENEVGVLNVDDLVAATRWNWKLCSVMGLYLC